MATALETLAVDLVNNWRIGAQHEGRGLLLLLVDETKQVKLEVGYALEDVFTDAFSGYVEDLQLGPYYRAGDVGTGLIAVMEMLEERAQIKDQGEYTPETDCPGRCRAAGRRCRCRRDLAALREQMHRPFLSRARAAGRAVPRRPGRSCSPSGPARAATSTWTSTRR